MGEVDRSINKVWEQIHSSREWGKYPTEMVIRFVAKNYYQTERKNIKILDFGCGQGSHTWYLAREGFDTYAFDGSESAVRRTKEYLDKEGLKANVRVMDGIAPDYEDNFFDAVIDSACIGCTTIKSIQRMYQETYRILKPGGRLLTTFFSTDTTGYGMGKYVEPGTYQDIPEGPVGDEGVIHFWTEKEFRETLAAAGYRNIQIEKFCFTSQAYVTAWLIASCRKE